jgi:predicted O-linked N-acetylglucosamine transferase (SPINDLY family)
MGVPVVTQAGQSHVSRVGVSLMSIVGLDELIGSGPEQVVELAVDLAKDLRHLAQLRQDLRSRMQASPLMDGARLARSVETAYRQMWRTWCASEVSGEGREITERQQRP